MGEMGGIPFQPEPIQAQRLQGPDRQEASSLPKVPLFATIEREAIKNNPGHKDSIENAFKGMNEQFIRNYSSFSSELFPGVSFAYTSITIDRELVEAISGITPKELIPPALGAKDVVSFIEPAFALPSEGDPSTSADEAAYLFFQQLLKIAVPMQNGETPPKAKIYVLGTPGGANGTITEQFLKAIGENGFDAHGKVYAEFVKRELAAVDLDKTQVRLHGASRGAPTVIATSANLPDEMKERTVITAKGEEKQTVTGISRFFDNPAGIQEGSRGHNILKAIQMASLVADIVKVMPLPVIKQGDPLIRGLSKKEFYKYISEHADIPSQKGQKLLKWRMFLAEANVLRRGTPATESAVAITSRLDPANPKGEVLKRILRNEDKEKPLIMYTDNKVHMAPVENNAGHAFNAIDRMLRPGRIGRRMSVLENLSPKQK